MDYDQTFMEFYVIVVLSIHSCIIFACVSFVAGKVATFMEMSDIGKYLFWGQKGKLKDSTVLFNQITHPWFCFKITFLF